MDKIADFLFEIGFLKKMKRSTLLTDFGESVSEHSFRAAIIGYLLAKETRLDADKVLTMLLFHDISETRTGDINYVQKKYISTNNRQVSWEILNGLPGSEEILCFLKEFEDGLTGEAKLAKDADVLSQLIEEKEILDNGNREAKNWLKYSLRKLMSPSAKNLGKSITKRKKFQWWRTIKKGNRKIS